MVLQTSRKDDFETRPPSYDAIDPTLSFFYRPHTISVLIGIILYLLYVSLFDIARTFEENVKREEFGLMIRGSLALVVVFLFIGLTQFGNGPFIRPHPALWRIVLASSVIYLLSLVFIIFQNVEDVRQLLTFFYPSLGKPLPEKSYAENCSVEWINLWNQMDIFIIAHSVGWYFKALMIRDYWILWILSVMFEIMEYSLQHQLPNFAECWWDHVFDVLIKWVLDVLVCNWLGIYLGCKTCEYFQMKAYSWRGIKEIIGYKGKVTRTMAQFTPHSWTSFYWWKGSKSFKHYVAILILIFMFLAAELNSFYLKYLLWVPPENPLNTYRLILYGLMGSVATREAYQYFLDPECKRLGSQAWITIACISAETLICVKFGKNQFPAPAPQYIVYLWIAIITFLIAFPLWQFLINPWINPSASTSTLSSPTRTPVVEIKRKRGRPKMEKFE